MEDATLLSIFKEIQALGVQLGVVQGEVKGINTAVQGILSAPMVDSMIDQKLRTHTEESNTERDVKSEAILTRAKVKFYLAGAALLGALGTLAGAYVIGG